MKNPSAYPRPTEFKDREKGWGKADIYEYGESGMTLLDYFAAKAMHATRSNPDLLQIVKDMAKDNKLNIYELLSEMSYEIARAMLKEREKHIK